MIDPYPADLEALDGPAIAANPDAVTNRLTTAINRLAQAIEQDALARLHPVTGSVAPQAVLAALPPVQTVADRPSCIYHGPDKVASSTNGKGGFYCQAKAAPGQPSNPKGYCTWHS